jgi:hypothetical protein
MPIVRDSRERGPIVLPKYVQVMLKWAFTLSVLGLCGAGLYGIRGGLYGFMPKASLYVASSVIVLGPLAGWLAYLIVARRDVLSDGARAFGNCDIVQKLLVVLAPAGMVAVAIFMVGVLIAVAFRFLPHAYVEKELVLYSKEPVPLIRQKDSCLYQAAVGFDDVQWLNQCLTKDQYEKLEPGRNRVQVKETVIGTYLQ